MRILSVSDFYPPVIGGMERHVRSLSEELVRRGHQVAVATLEHAGSPSREVVGGVRVHRVGGFSRALKPFYQSAERPFHPTVPDPGVMMALLRVIREEKPDIVHARGWMIYSVLPLKRKAGWAAVVTLHDYGLRCPKKTFMYDNQICSGPRFGKCVRCAGEAMGVPKALGVTTGLHLSGPLHSQVDRFIAVSRSVAEASILGTRGRRIDVIPSLVPDGILEVARNAPRPPFCPADGYILYVGGLRRDKGFNVLLEAHARLRHRVPLVVLATPPALDVPELPRDVTVVVGADHEVVMGAWAHCLLGVVPSTWAEPFGQVAVEAMAAGKAVVASDIGGLIDIVVPGETGLLVPHGEPAALCEAIDTLLGDPSRREIMGAAGRSRAPRFFASTVTARVEAVYLDVLAERRSREGPADKVVS